MKLDGETVTEVLLASPAAVTETTQTLHPPDVSLQGEPSAYCSPKSGSSTLPSLRSSADLPWTYQATYNPSTSGALVSMFIENFSIKSRNGQKNVWFGGWIDRVPWTPQEISSTSEKPIPDLLSLPDLSFSSVRSQMPWAGKALKPEKCTSWMMEKS